MGKTETKQNQTEPYEASAFLLGREVMFRREGMFEIAVVSWKLYGWDQVNCHGW